MTETRSGAAGVRQAIEDRVVVSAGERKAEPVGASRPGGWEPDELGLPPDCPVTPLGVAGDNYWFLDTIKQLRCVEDSKFSKNKTTSLFHGRAEYLYWAWPRLSKGGEPTGWRNELVQESLTKACSKRSGWEPKDKVRGRGAWLGERGDLVLHLGDKVLIGGRICDPGVHGEHVYPLRPVVAAPWGMSIQDGRDPAMELLPLFRSWNWARPKIDPVLLLGWIGVAFLGASLQVRPAIYVVGDKGTGKSTLQKVVKWICGDWMVQSVNATAAGIWQAINFDSLSVALDEFEGKAQNARSKAVIELMRAAYSGGEAHRGGDKHVGVSFNVRSAFLFSSINPPPLEPQDLSRLAILQMRRADGPVPELDKARLAEAGRMVLRRLMDGWSTFPAQYRAYAEVLASAGHDQRGQDTYGTLLAIASIIVGDKFEALDVPLGDDLSEWGRLLKAANMAESEDALPNWLAALNHMLSVDVEAWRGGAKETVGSMILKVWQTPDEFNQARTNLAHAGLGLCRPPGAYARKGVTLFVPNASPKVRRLYLDTKWVGEEGASVWSSALRQGPPEMWRAGQERVNGAKVRGTHIDIDRLYGVGGIMAVDEDGGLPLATDQ